MKYKPNIIYHIYNQGNNKQKIFIEDRNYLFFLDKMRKHLLPYVDVLSYCLMPNHFHWLVYVREEACQPFDHRRSKICNNLKTTDTYSIQHKQILSHSIGTLLSSYTKAINKQQNWSGSLFRSKTKSKDVLENILITTRNNETNHFLNAEKDYAIKCFNYIHQNPVKAGLVNIEENYIYSSAREYKGISSDAICNIRLAKHIGLVSF